MAAGAGRARKEDAIDPAAGLVLAVKTGDRVEEGDPLGTVYATDSARLDEAAARLRSAIFVGDEEVEPPPLLLEA